MDFVGFKFNEHHSLDFGIYRVSNGSRYQESLIPTFSDYTSEVQGRDGTHYWGSNFKAKTFDFSLAFDNLTEQKLREMRQWLATPKLSKLIFDETPYKYYMGKVSAEPKIDYICFDVFDSKEGRNKRIYKGECSVSISCFYPFARSVHKFLNEYDDNEYDNKIEWEESTGMLEERDNLDTLRSGNNLAYIYNPGDMEADWKVVLNKDTIGDFEVRITNNSYEDENFVIGTTLNNEQVELGELGEIIKNTTGKIEIDTKKRMVTFIYKDNGEDKRLPALFLLRSGEMFTFKNRSEVETLQFNFTNIENDEDIEIEYDYLYY